MPPARARFRRTHHRHHGNATPRSQKGLRKTTTEICLRELRQRSISVAEISAAKRNSGRFPCSKRTRRKTQQIPVRYLLSKTERGRFELPMTRRPCWFSRPVRSTALAPLQMTKLVADKHLCIGRSQRQLMVALRSHNRRGRSRPATTRNDREPLRWPLPKVDCQDPSAILQMFQ